MSESNQATSVAVMADAQFGNVAVLLPYDDFEDRYQGLSGQLCIAFPGGRDPHAESHESGYDPNLQLGYPVPRGARLSVAIPLCEDQQGTVALYRYFMIFRDRNIRDYRNPTGGRTRPSWHYPVQRLGATDNSLAINAGRYPIDARYHALLFEPTEPAGAAAMAATNAYPEAIVPQRIFSPNGLHANGQPIRLQQGIYDPVVVPHGRDAMRPEFQLDASGDDMIILAQKLPDEEGDFDTWDFDGDDLPFSNIYGRGGYTEPYAHPGVRFIDGGIRVCAGSNP